MTETADEKVLAFLKELTVLSNKHKLVLTACGCCESPWVHKVKSDGEYICNDQGFDLRFVERVRDEDGDPVELDSSALPKRKEIHTGKTVAFR